MNAASTLTLLQRFDKVTSARRRVLGETQRRIQRLGDVINRMGLTEDTLQDSVVEQIRLMTAEMEARRQRVEALQQRKTALTIAAANHRQQITALLDRRETAMADHEELVTVLQEVYVALQGETDGVNRTLVQDLGTSFQALERSTLRVQDRRKTLNMSRRSVLLQSEDGESFAVEEGDSVVTTATRTTPASTAPCSPRTPRSVSAVSLAATAATPQTPDSAVLCPFSPAPTRRATAYDMPTVPFDLSDDEDEDGIMTPHAPATPAKEKPKIAPKPSLKSAISTPTLSSASVGPVRALRPAPPPPPPATATTPGAAKPPPPMVPPRKKHGVVAAAAAAAAIAATTNSAPADTTIELSVLEEGPEARPVHLKHLTPEQVELIYKQRSEARHRAHEVSAHKCPTRRRPCNQCGQHIGRGKTHYRCGQCGFHFCDICERAGIDATCAPPPYHDKNARKRAPVAPGRNLENDVYLDLQRPQSRHILLPRLVYDCIKELDVRVPKAIPDAVETIQGVFRVAGSARAVERLMQAYFEGRAPWLRNEDIHDIASVLKTYLRGLDEPLLTFRLYSAFIDVGRRLKTMPEESIYAELERVLSELPPINFFTAWYLLRLLHRLSHYSEGTKMTEENYAITIGPTILRAPKVSAELVDVAAGLVTRVTQWLIKFPRHRWETLHREFLERSQLAFDISPVPSVRHK